MPRHSDENPGKKKLQHSKPVEQDVGLTRREFGEEVAKRMGGAALAAMALTSDAQADEVKEESEVWTAEALQAHLDQEQRDGKIVYVQLKDAIRKEHTGCGDGRADRPLAGTFGGTAGRMILEAHALENVTGSALTDAEIGQWVKAMAKNEGIHLHTDAAHGMAHLAEELGVQPAEAIKLVRNPGKRRAEVLRALLKANCMGCGDLKNKATHEEDYKKLDGTQQLRKGLPTQILTAVFNELLDGNANVNFEVLQEHKHAEGGVLFLEGQATKGTDKIPLVTPNYKGKQVFVVNKPLQRFMDGQFVERVEQLTGRTVDAKELTKMLDDLTTPYILATANVVKVGKKKASELPMFAGSFDANQRITVAKA